ncbi:DUF6207 family protein [Streptomyces longispororuber]|uniref:DUF6207 family protein n=1 Tax=Streptomyces longispororuber TaxID=68230 RepID=UPI0033D67C44
MDDATACAAQEPLAARRAPPKDRTVPEPGKPGMRLRLLLGLRCGDNQDEAVNSGDRGHRVGGHRPGEPRGRPAP